MTRKKHSKKKKNITPDINSNLPGFDININSFGEIQSTYDIDSVNTFLNQNLEDKKLRNKIQKEKNKQNLKDENKDGRNDENES